MFNPPYRNIYLMTHSKILTTNPHQHEYKESEWSKNYSPQKQIQQM